MMHRIRFNVVTIINEVRFPAGSIYEASGFQIQQMEAGCGPCGTMQIVDKKFWTFVANEQTFSVNEDLITVIPDSDSAMLEPGSPQDRLNDRVAGNYVPDTYRPNAEWHRWNKELTVIDLRRK